MKRDFKIVGCVGQWLALVSCVVGIVIEIKYGANIGYIAITAGSLIFSIATKIKCEGLKK